MESSVAVKVRGIAAGGAGVADLPDGRVVFVPRTAPGDRAMIRIEKSRPRWAEGSLQELLEPAAERREPHCALYDRCGGCQLQHLPYARQLEWKGRFVVDALERIGKLTRVAVPEVVASPSETRYRSRVTFTLRRLKGGHVVAGFHALGRPAHVVDVGDECVLPQPELRGAWSTLRAAWGQGARSLPSGGRLRLTLRAEPRGVALVVEGGRPGWRSQELASAVPELVAIWHRPTGSDAEARLASGFADESAVPAFTQVNPEAAKLLVDHVVSLAGAGGHAIDAYCGAGAYGRALAECGWSVTGIERDPAASRSARAGAPSGFALVEGSVEEQLERALPADLLIVNPPRSGLDTDALRAIASKRPPRLIYVSCDPATLARDVAGLSHAYAQESLRCFDLFPQTAHVETVMALRTGAS